MPKVRPLLFGPLMTVVPSFWATGRRDDSDRRKAERVHLGGLPHRQRDLRRRSRSTPIASQCLQLVEAHALDMGGGVDDGYAVVSRYGHRERSVFEGLGLRHAQNDRAVVRHKPSVISGDRHPGNMPH